MYQRTMKKVFVIERSADVLNTAKHYLKENDIDYSAFQSIREALGSSDLPALIFFSPTIALMR